jgi:hypothetical protein
VAAPVKAKPSLLAQIIARQLIEYAEGARDEPPRAEGVSAAELYLALRALGRDPLEVARRARKRWERQRAESLEGALGGAPAAAGAPATAGAPAAPAAAGRGERRWAVGRARLGKRQLKELAEWLAAAGMGVLVYLDEEGLHAVGLLDGRRRLVSLDVDRSFFGFGDSYEVGGRTRPYALLGQLGSALWRVRKADEVELVADEEGLWLSGGGEEALVASVHVEPEEERRMEEALGMLKRLRESWWQYTPDWLEVHPHGLRALLEYAKLLREEVGDPVLVVRWEGGEPQLAVAAENAEGVRAYAELPKEFVLRHSESWWKTYEGQYPLGWVAAVPKGVDSAYVRTGHRETERGREGGLLRLSLSGGGAYLNVVQTPLAERVRAERPRFAYSLSIGAEGEAYAALFSLLGEMEARALLEGDRYSFRIRALNGERTAFLEAEVASPEVPVSRRELETALALNSAVGRALARATDTLSRIALSRFAEPHVAVDEEGGVWVSGIRVLPPSRAEEARREAEELRRFFEARVWRSAAALPHLVVDGGALVAAVKKLVDRREAAVVRVRLEPSGRGVVEVLDSGGNVVWRHEGELERGAPAKPLEGRFRITGQGRFPVPLNQPLMRGRRVYISLAEAREGEPPLLALSYGLGSFVVDAFVAPSAG